MTEFLNFSFWFQGGSHPHSHKILQKSEQCEYVRSIGHGSLFVRVTNDKAYEVFPVLNDPTYKQGSVDVKVFL